LRGWLKRLSGGEIFGFVKFSQHEIVTRSLDSGYSLARYQCATL